MYIFGILFLNKIFTVHGKLINFFCSVRKVLCNRFAKLRRCITLLPGRVIESQFSYVTQESFHAFGQSGRGCFSRNR